MQFFFILWMIFAVAVTLFATLNGTPVRVNLVFNSYETSLALVILGSAIIGALAGYTIDMVPRIKNKMQIRELEKKLKQTESELANSNGLLANIAAANVEPVIPVEPVVESSPRSQEPV